MQLPTGFLSGHSPSEPSHRAVRKPSSRLEVQVWLPAAVPDNSQKPLPDVK